MCLAAGNGTEQTRFGRPVAAHDRFEGTHDGSRSLRAATRSEGLWCCSSDEGSRPTGPRPNSQSSSEASPLPVEDGSDESAGRHRPVNHLYRACASARRAALGGHSSRHRVEVHGVTEPFELRHQPAGVRFVVAPSQPVGAQVQVGLVLGQHVPGRDQDRVGDRHLRTARSSTFGQAGVLRREIVLVAHPTDRPRSLDQHRGEPLVPVTLA